MKRISEDYVGRLAPSPTGPIHLGIAQTSLAAWLDARAAKGRLILRIEDVDRARAREEAIAGIIQDLRWLGLDWDAGPDVGGPEGPYLQSERSALYTEMLARIETEGRTFACTCTRREVAVASAPHGPADEGPRYPGTCRDTPSIRSDRSPSMRLRTEPSDRVRHIDRRLGVLEENVHERVGDFVLRRADGLWAYQFAVVVDDLVQGVTCVVRGDDLWSSMGRQLLLRQLIHPDAAPLRTLHLPLVYGPDGKRLAKREGAASVAGLRAQGISPSEILTILAQGLSLRIPPGGLARPYDLVGPWADRWGRG